MLRISVKKQRNIPISKISLTGKISSVKENRMVEFESSLERDYIQILEFDWHVEYYCEQPVKIFYEENHQTHYYTPDFFVDYGEGYCEVIEIKYSEDLIKNKTQYDKKFEIAEEFCAKNNMKFKILTEKDIRTYKLFNARFLLNYKIPKFGLVQYDFRIIHQLVNEHKQISVKDLVERSALEKYRRAEMLYNIWFMAANYFINIDLTQKITMNSIISRYDSDE